MYSMCLSVPPVAIHCHNHTCSLLGVCLLFPPPLPHLLSPYPFPTSSPPTPFPPPLPPPLPLLLSPHPFPSPVPLQKYLAPQLVFLSDDPNDRDALYNSMRIYGTILLIFLALIVFVGVKFVSLCRCTM